jgi:hypothetical protein
MNLIFSKNSFILYCIAIFGLFSGIIIYDNLTAPSPSQLQQKMKESLSNSQKLFKMQYGISIVSINRDNTIAKDQNNQEYYILRNSDKSLNSVYKIGEKSPDTIIPLSIVEGGTVDGLGYTSTKVKYQLQPQTDVLVYSSEDEQLFNPAKTLKKYNKYEYSRLLTKLKKIN